MVELVAPPPVAVDEETVGEHGPGWVALLVVVLVCPLLLMVSMVAALFLHPSNLFSADWAALLIPGCIPPGLAAVAVGRWALAPKQRASPDARAVTYASVGLFLGLLGLVWLMALLDKLPRWLR